MKGDERVRTSGWSVFLTLVQDFESVAVLSRLVCPDPRYDVEGRDSRIRGHSVIYELRIYH